MAKKSTSKYTVGQISAALDAIAPLSLAQSWDNVGLLVGNQSAKCRRILLCIDLITPVLNEAIANKCEFIISYHPPIFQPVAKLLADSTDTDAIVHRAIANGIAVYSPHTALDAAEGGTNDVIAGLCKLTDVEPFEFIANDNCQYKIVTFVPPAQIDMVASAMFDAGAGQIGEYQQCSYRIRGEGTFFGTQGTHPQLGKKGRLERVAETRIEMVCPDFCLPEAIAALHQSHPYEEPAFDIYPLQPEPTAGIGRVGILPPKTTLGSLAKTLQKATQSKIMTIVGPDKTKIRRAAVCVGAAGRLPLEKNRPADCDVIVTGEIRHHDALTILRNQKTAIALGHWESERPVLKSLAQRLSASPIGITTIISKRDKGPFDKL
ncbi:MAG: Nif3-like dinuclear metal center hexameric protein [Planctomycetota bacterium]|nr:MAG: Nif3-like dinuclear metal center hexameric protein [Planctomycetota bacterium]